MKTDKIAIIGAGEAGRISTTIAHRGITIHTGEEFAKKFKEALPEPEVLKLQDRYLHEHKYEVDENAFNPNKSRPKRCPKKRKSKSKAQRKARKKNRK